jgi:cytochrome c-type biogenesis protein CcmE
VTGRVPAREPSPTPPGRFHDDPDDDGALDLTPRPPAPSPARPARRSPLRAAVLAAVAVAGLGFVTFRGLGNATLFFYNVDEALAQREELGERRFRLQGTVVPDSVSRGDDGARFEVTFDGAVAAVRHRGDLPQLFQPNIPVVLEGHWEGDWFESDRMLVKHDEVYQAENPDRVGDYDGAAAE